MFVVEIDSDTLKIITETHNDVKHLVQSNEEYKKKYGELKHGSCHWWALSDFLRNNSGDS